MWCCDWSDGSDDPDTTPFLEIADQKGNPLKVPPSEKKVCCLDLNPLTAELVCVWVCLSICLSGAGCGHGFPWKRSFTHEEETVWERSLSPAAGRPSLQVCDHCPLWPWTWWSRSCNPGPVFTLMWWVFSSKCGSMLLSSVDNFAVLQLDIVWCYQALEALSCLDDARKRLQRAEDGFLQCYGQQQQRLLMIKVRQESSRRMHTCAWKSTQKHSSVLPG